MYALFFSEETPEIYCYLVGQDNEQGVSDAQKVYYQTSLTTVQQLKLSGSLQEAFAGW